LTSMFSIAHRSLIATAPSASFSGGSLG
jgi:hypothetical protein